MNETTSRFIGMYKNDPLGALFAIDKYAMRNAYFDGGAAAEALGLEWGDRGYRLAQFTKDNIATFTGAALIENKLFTP